MRRKCVFEDCGNQIEYQTRNLFVKYSTIHCCSDTNQLQDQYKKEYFPCIQALLNSYSVNWFVISWQNRYNLAHFNKTLNTTG